MKRIGQGSRSRLPLPLAIALLLALALLASCGKDKSPTAPVDPWLTASRAAPQDLLETWFELAYSRQDSARYAAMLDPDFQFVFLPEDADSLRPILGEFNFWGRTLDLRSTGKTFRSSYVGDISLDIRINQEFADTSCAGCRRVETNVTLRVETDPQSADPLILAVDSPQTFVIRPDPADSTQWVIYRQYDRAQFGAMRADALGESSATEPGTWGRIKGMWK